MKKKFMFRSIFWKKTVDFIIYNSGENQKTYRDRTFGTPGIGILIALYFTKT